MMRWTITEADRDASGRIIVNPFERELERAMTDVGAPAPPKEGESPRKPWRPSKMELAALVSGLVLVVAVIAFLNSFTPARAPRSGPTVLPVATMTPMVVTPTRTATATATPTEVPPTPEPPPPTPEVVYVPVAPPCNPEVNPRFSVHIDLSPLGSVTGVSCDSLAEAQTNANRLADDMRATAGTP